MEMKKFLFLLSFFSILFANNIGLLLNEIEKKDDLSQKTKMESAGISYIITRYQLEMMQAKTLGDILKNTIIGYAESRYAIVDPWHSPFIPYSSFGVRVFLDNQEISVGQYDNSLFLLSKMDISFVDHVEVYYMTPSYSLTNEPAYVIIKLYTKNAKRDEGLRFAGSYGTYKTNIESMDFAKPEVFKNYSTLIHLSRTQLNHKKYQIKSSIISRDSLTNHFLWTIYNDNTRFLLTYIDYDQDAFLGLSLDGNIKTSKINSKLFHFGIDTKNEKYTFKYTFDVMKDKSEFVENNNGILFFSLKTFEPIRSVYTSDYSYINSFKLHYKNKSDKNNIIIGAGYRNKIMDYDKIRVDERDIDYSGNKREDIVNLYFENNYQYKKNAVFTIGSSVSKYFAKDNNHFLKQFKIGNTYLINSKNIIKLFYQHFEFLTGSYITSTLLKNNEMLPQKTDVVIGKYKKILTKSDSIEFAGLISRTKNILTVSEEGYTYKKYYVDIKVLNLRYHKNYNFINDFIFEFSRMFFNKLGMNSYDRLTLLNTHRYKKFEFFESVVYRKSKFPNSHHEGTDLSLGVKYNVNDNLTVGIKGDNLLNERYENGYPLVNIFTRDYKLFYSPLIERRVLFSLEYMF
jgi:iron complex outermembrane receptor protein